MPLRASCSTRARVVWRSPLGRCSRIHSRRASRRSRPCDGSGTTVGSTSFRCRRCCMVVRIFEYLGTARPGSARPKQLRSVTRMAAALGAGAMVFGSPRNRLREDMPVDVAERIAAEFFGELGAYAAERGLALCLEANAPAYGCDFICRTKDAVALVRRVDHPGLPCTGRYVDHGHEWGGLSDGDRYGFAVRGARAHQRATSRTCWAARPGTGQDSAGGYRRGPLQWLGSRSRCDR